MDAALTYVGNLLGGLIGFFDDLLAAIPGSLDVIMSVFAMYASVRLFLKPIIGGSDRVRKTKEKGSSEDG